MTHEDLKQLILVSKSVNEAVFSLVQGNLFDLKQCTFRRFVSWVPSFAFLLHFNIYVLQTLIAKELHFAYSTPRAKRASRKDEDLGLDGDLEDSREVPNAPRQCRVAKSRMNFEKLGSVTVDLFPLFDDQRPPNNGLAGEI